MLNADGQRVNDAAVYRHMLTGKCDQMGWLWLVLCRKWKWNCVQCSWSEADGMYQRIQRLTIHIIAFCCNWLNKYISRGACRRRQIRRKATMRWRGMVSNVHRWIQWEAVVEHSRWQTVPRYGSTERKTSLTDGCLYFWHVNTTSWCRQQPMTTPDTAQSSGR